MSTTEALATEIRTRLGPCAEPGELPPVSIVVLNHDGAEHLRRLLAGLIERTDYPDLELIVVDNGSGDESIEFLRGVRAPFPVSIVANHHNESFSDANNDAARLARGDLLLFLNNDIEPFEPGWLVELVACLAQPGTGAAGATLITPDGAGDSTTGYRVQSRQVRFRGSGDEISAVPGGGRRDVFGEGFGEDIDSTFAIGACVLIERGLFWRIGGFTHGFFFGGEDIDLFLKLRTQGLRFLYSGRTFLIHAASSTFESKLDEEERAALQRRNSRLLWRRWGPRVWRDYELDRLAGGGVWAAPGQEDLPGAPTRQQILALGFCLKADRAGGAEQAWLAKLRDELQGRGHRCRCSRDEPIDAPSALAYDVVVHLRGPIRYVPNPGQLNVLWIVSHMDDPTGVECAQHDLALTADRELAARLRGDGNGMPLVALDRERPVQHLVDAVLAHAGRIDLPIRLSPAPETRARARVGT